MYTEEYSIETVGQLLKELGEHHPSKEVYYTLVSKDRTKDIEELELYDLPGNKEGKFSFILQDAEEINLRLPTLTILNLMILLKISEDVELEFKLKVGDSLRLLKLVTIFNEEDSIQFILRQA